MSESNSSPVTTPSAGKTGAPVHRRELLAVGAAVGGALIGIPREVRAHGPVTVRQESGTPGVYNILDFGAVPGELSTEAIQRAVDACHEAGGGRVVVPPGTYIIGTVILKSRVNLHLEQGAELFASPNREHYHSTFRRHGMLFCEDAYQVSITGLGVVNGGASRFYDPQRNHYPERIDRSLTRQGAAFMDESVLSPDGPIARTGNPMGFAIEFYHCNQVTIKDITIRETPIWATRFAYCDDVLVEGVSIQNVLAHPNSDGLHITVTRNMRIANCDIRAGDDAIVVTGFAKIENRPGYTSEEQDRWTYGNKTPYAENIQVTNCHLQTRSAGIRVGYGQPPIRRLTFSNIVIYGSNRGIGVFARDASSIEDLMFSNIMIETRLHTGNWWGKSEPIHLSALTRFAGEPVGTIRNVRFNNIIATSEQGILVYSQPDHPMENIQFEDVQLRIVRGRETLSYGGNFDLRPSADPALNIFRHDIPGLYAQHVNNLTIRDFRLSWGEDLPPFFTHGIECHNVSGLELRNVAAPPNPGSPGSESQRLAQTTVVS